MAALRAQALPLTLTVALARAPSTHHDTVLTTPKPQPAIFEPRHVERHAPIGPAAREHQDDDPGFA